MNPAGGSLGAVAQGSGGAAAGSIVTNGGLGGVGAGTLTYAQAAPMASGVDSMAAGVKSSVKAGVTGGTTYGAWSNVSGNNGTAIGYRALAGAGSVALGFENQATGNQSLAIGYRNLVTGNNSGAIGSPNTVSGNGSYAVGNNNTIAANNSFVFGNNVTIPVGAHNSVVLGNGSASGGANTVSVGAVGATRRITNVAPGVDLTDAVNVSQLNGVSGALNSAITNLSFDLNKVSRRAYGGVAQALGAGTIDLPLDPGEYGMVGSIGVYAGQTGYNIKFQGRPTDRISVGAGVGLSEDGTVGASAAVGIKF